MYTKTKIILDTDIGYDPDDLFALLFLHSLAPEHLALIVTANEYQSKRLQFLGKILRYIDNPLQSVARGNSLGLEKFTVETLLADKSYYPDEIDLVDYKKQMASIVNYFDKTIYIGIGGFTNLAKFIDEYPAESKKMKIFMMGGAFNYERYEDWIEYNVKIDPASTEKVINADLDITLIMAQTTHNPLYEVTQESSLYKKLKQSERPIHKLLVQHCDLWFEQRDFKHGTAMHDPLTVATALGYGFVTLETAKVSIKDRKFVPDENGHIIKYSVPSSKAQEFMEFLEQTLC